MTCGSIAAVGLHLMSWHSAEGYSGRNPGLYVRADCGVQLGVYRNSERRVTAYATYVRDAGPLFVAGGLATGYAAYPVPIALAGVRLGPVRLGYIPRLGRINDSHVVHVAIERKF